MITNITDTRSSSDEERELPVEQLATLLGSALDDTSAQWGCVLTAQSVTDGHALVVIDRSPGDNCPTSGATTPTDMLLMAAFERSRPVFVNRVSHPTLAGLPEGYPAIHAFALLPCQLSEQIVAVICLVNPQQAFASPVINRLHAGMRLSTSALKTPTADTMLSDALSVYFQPQWNLDTGTLYGLEVLARWHARSDPPSTPSCLKLLQRQGKLAEVGHHIIASVCEHWATWDAANLIEPHVNLAINIAREQLLAPDFVSRLSSELNSHSIEPRRVVLEIHEDIWLEAESRTTLDELNRLGCRLAIDGFGTGQSSLPWLARLPVDQLKLGHTFVAKLGNTSGDRGGDRGGDTSRDAGGRGGGTDNRHSDDAWSLISGIVELARCLVLPVIAQGVEDRLTRDTLAAAGCTACQGYGLAPPLPASEIPAFLGQMSRYDLDALARFVNLSDDSSDESAYETRSKTRQRLLHAPA